MVVIILLIGSKLKMTKDLEIPGAYRKMIFFSWTYPVARWVSTLKSSCITSNSSDRNGKYNNFTLIVKPVDWSCRLSRVHLCKGVRPLPPILSQRVSWIQLNYSEAPVLGLSRMWSTPSLSLLPGPLWPAEIIILRDQSIDQIHLFNHLQYLKLIN